MGSEMCIRDRLRPVIDVWFAGLQRDIETITDPLCRDHGLPAMVLSLSDSQHVAKHLEGLSLAMPDVGTMESDTALVGTTLSAILVGSLLAHANIFAALFLNPIGIILGGAMLGGTYMFGKKAIAGKVRSAKMPVLARQILTDGRIRSAVSRQRADLIKPFKPHGLRPPLTGLQRNLQRCWGQPSGNALMNARFCSSFNLLSRCFILYLNLAR